MDYKNKAIKLNNIKITTYLIFLLLFILVLVACDQNFTDSDGGPVLDSANQPDSSSDVSNDTNGPPPTKSPDLAGTIERISLNSHGVEANANSINSDISADGRYVVFNSIADNLVENDGNSTWDIFLRDRDLQQTYRMSQPATGEDAFGASLEPAISQDGRFIAFSSVADNLVENDKNGVSDIFIVHRESGEVERITIASDGNDSNGKSESPALSEDGRYVVFSSMATNLVESHTLTDINQIYIHDRHSGETTLVSIGIDGVEGNADSRSPSISHNGQIVAFESIADNLVANDSNQIRDIFVRDITNRATVRITVNSAGQQANQGSITPKISGDGRTVVFHSNASNLVDDDSNQVQDIFVADLISMEIERVSVNDIGEAGNASVFASPDISFDGRFVVFYSAADNIVANDVNNAWDVFIRDRDSQTTKLVSQSATGGQGNGSSFVPAMTADGHYVVFGSQASNFIENDTNDSWDIFIHVLVSSNAPPVADAGNDDVLVLGHSLQLDGSNSQDPDSSPNEFLSYSWSIFDAPKQSQAGLLLPESVTPVFTPDMTGDYIIELIVNDGELSSAPSHVLISVVENAPPVAVLNTDLTTGSVPLTVQFSAVDSYDPDNESIAVSWDFNDPKSVENHSDEMQVAHTFTNPGSYRVVLTVQDDYGNSSEAAVKIRVLGSNLPAAVSPTATPRQGSAPLEVKFQANALDAEADELKYFWDFDDGASSEEINPTHTFTDPGVFNVTLVVHDGQSETKAHLLISVGSSLEFETLYSHIKLKSMQNDKDRLYIKTKFIMDKPLVPDSNIELMIDGITVFSSVFSEFEKIKHHNNAYFHKTKNIRVYMDLDVGIIALLAIRQSLYEIDNSDGVDILLKLGEVSALENLAMQEKSKCDAGFYKKKTLRKYNSGNCDNRRSIVLSYKKYTHRYNDVFGTID